MLCFIKKRLTWIKLSANKLQDDVSTNFISKSIQMLSKSLFQILLVFVPHSNHSSHFELHRRFLLLLALSISGGCGETQCFD